MIMDMEKLELNGKVIQKALLWKCNILEEEVDSLAIKPFLNEMAIEIYIDALKWNLRKNVPC